jgi:hypothetical protein
MESLAGSLAPPCSRHLQQWNGGDITPAVFLDCCTAPCAHYRPTLLEPLPAYSMFTGVFSPSSKSKPYRNISRNKVSAIYAHYNNIKPLNNLFLPKPYLDGEAMGVSCICRQYGEGAQVTFAPCFNLTSNLKFLIAPPCCGHTLILIVHCLQ